MSAAASLAQRSVGNASQSSRSPAPLGARSSPHANSMVTVSWQRGSRRPAIQACNVTSAPLAEYPFPSDVQRSGGLFTSAILQVVQNISSKPFLQCSYRRAVGAHHERHPAPACMVGNPEAWVGFADSLSAEGPPDHLIFVHPVDSPSEFCGRCNALPSDAPCRTTAVDQCSLEGKVGDECCDDAFRSEEINAQRVLHTPDHLLDSGDLQRHGLHVQYYGLVAQSRLKEPSDGCYLIKTVQQLDSPGCHCMHYSLMRVCNTVPLHQQALEFWL